MMIKEYTKGVTLQMKKESQVPTLQKNLNFTLMMKGGLID